MTTETAVSATASAQTSTHPLDPMTAAELQQAAALCLAHHPSDRLRFALISTQEPEKSAVTAFQPGQSLDRRAFVVALDRADGKVYEGIANLTTNTVDSWQHKPGVQSIPLLEEFAEADAVIRADPGWRAALERRGITDFDKIQIDPWPAGNFGAPEEQGKRILRGISYVTEEKGSHGYARPIEGLVAVVDLNAGEVLTLVDEGDAPVPAADIRYDAESQPALRDDLKPLQIAQPEGVSFSLEGHELRWQKWRMRVSLHPRDGLVLHQIGYEHRGDVRRICYRAALSEMVVPYGDPSVGQYWKNAFDSGELGLGRLSNALELGCDCLGEIVYLDGIVNDDKGNGRTMPNAICIHEEDSNLLWKHTNGHNDGHAEVRRSRRLVVSSWATVGNYDYGFYWYFYEDGEIEFEVKLTGIVQTMAVTDDDTSPTAQRIGKNLAAPIHQHFFSMRMDMDIDGDGNSVYEVDSTPLPRGPENPEGNAFIPVQTLIASEADAGRSVRSASARHWRITNPNKRNAVGEPVAYALYPGETCDMMAHEDSAVGKRAVFARKQLWVTQYAADELYAAGDFPVQSTGGDGMPAFTAGDRSLDNEDVVIWYTVGTSHIVRPEDFPVSPVHHAGFRLRPWGFFDANPALDVAPPTAACICPPGECTCDH